MALTKLTTVGASQKTANLTTLHDSNDVVRVQATTSGAVVTGILTATSFDGVSESDTPLAVNSSFYEIDDVLTVSATIQITRASSNPGTIYVKHKEVEIAAPRELIIGNGEELVINVYQLT